MTWRDRLKVWVITLALHATKHKAYCKQCGDPYRSWIFGPHPLIGCDRPLINERRIKFK